MNVKKNHSNLKRPNGLEGRYANYFKIGYNAFEFVLDFGQLYNGHKKPQLYSRIITNPASVKNLLSLLRESVEGYEQSFGAIADEVENGDHNIE